jgi:N-acetylneuraminic acid mutarotase
LTSIERTTVNPDGSLSPFVTLPVQLTTPRYFSASVVIGDSIYLLGGKTISLNQVASVERATINPDGSLTPFETAASRLQTARDSHAAIVIGSSLYVLGGSVGQQSSNTLTTVERASIKPDGSLESFVTVGSVLTTPRSGCAAAVLGHSLYVVGGTSQTTSVERATIGANDELSPFSVVSGGNLSHKRSHHTTAVVGNSLYAIGGISSDAPSLTSVERASLNASGKISSLEPLLGNYLIGPVSRHASVVLGNQLYVVGGSSSGGPAVEVERAPIAVDGSLSKFDFAPNVNLVEARIDHSTAVVGDSLYVFGGRGVAGTTLASVERATIRPDGTLSTFRTVAGTVLVTARSGHTTVVAGNGLYVLGGSDKSGAALTSIERAGIQFDGSLTAFATLTGATLASARARHTSAVLGNSVYTLLGWYPDAYRSSVERAIVPADGTLMTFAGVPGVNATTPRGRYTSSIVGSTLYLIGGEGASNMDLLSVERADLNADGSLGPLAAVPGIQLTTARSGHTAHVIGNWLYVIGGSSSRVTEWATLP